MGLKSTALSVDISTLRVDLALSNIINRGVLPEADVNLPTSGVVVTLETSERRRPLVGTIGKSLSGGGITLTKTGVSAGELCVYEIEVPIEERASVLGYFRFRTRTAWNQSTHDWCNLSNVTGMYFGLEHGTFNTAAYAFLRNDGSSGSLVVGGPLQAFNSARPGQTEYGNFNWLLYPNNSIVELWLYFNVPGYPDPFSPSDVPLIEVWAKGPGDAIPVVLGRIPVGSFGTFPSPPFTNSRLGVSQKARLFFGNISSVAADVLQLDDWAVYPDYQMGAFEGIRRPNHNLIIRPDVPMAYRANSNLLPDELVPGRWFTATDIGNAPNPSLHFQPGSRDAASYIVIPKLEAGQKTAFFREEPRLETRLDGVVVEAFIAAESVSNDGHALGTGFGISDGVSFFEVLAVQSPDKRTWGLVKDIANLSDIDLGYHTGVEVDFRTLKLVRLVIDRRRPVSLGGGKAILYVDGVKVLTKDLGSDTFPLALSATGKIYMGHLESPNAASKLNVALLDYLVRYLAWEGEDHLSPEDAGIDAGVRFSRNVSGSGTTSIVGDTLKIQTLSPGDGASFLKRQNFSEVHGLQVDFRTRVDIYTGIGGETFASKSFLGVGLILFFGNKQLELSFYDCGVHGRFIGIAPADLDRSQIINQTEIGRAVSARVDWTQMTDYRLIVKGKDRIELIIDSAVDRPAIVIPWRNDTDGFDLTSNGLAQPGLIFGTFSNQVTSTSYWEYVRWGMSNGYEVALQREYPNGFPSSAFGGKALLSVNVEETAAGETVPSFDTVAATTTSFPHAFCGFCSFGDGRAVLFSGSDEFLSDNHVETEIISSDGLSVVQGGDTTETNIVPQSTLLGDGRILAVGGWNPSRLVSNSRVAETLDPGTLVWTPSPNYPLYVTGHQIVTLATGNALVMGGSSMNPGDQSTAATAAVNEYDFGTDSWIARAPMNFPRLEFCAVTLSDGRVFVFGGYQATGAFVYTADAEIYDPGLDTWTVVTSSPIPLVDISAVLLNDGRVLVSSGVNTDVYFDGILTTPLIYDPADDSWVTTGALPATGINVVSSFQLKGTLLLSDGRALTADTITSSILIYNPVADSWTHVGALAISHVQAGLFLIPTDRIMIAGGFDNGTGLATFGVETSS